MQLLELQRKISAREAVIGVVGLGYVGIPVAAVFAQVGFRVIGVDIQSERVESVRAGQSPFGGKEPGLDRLLAEVVSAGRLQATLDYQALSQAQVVLVAVETPVDSHQIPRFRALRSASQSLGAVMRPGVLVVVESTVSPGTVDGMVRETLERESGGKVNVDFWLGVCPERVMPGKLLSNLKSMSRVCGGSTPEVAAVLKTLYQWVVQADLDLTDIVTAELVKTIENAYRDTQIAFANEIALICEALGADGWRVRELVNKSPGRNMHLPGAGVGGHCIPKDSWLLAYPVREKLPLRLIPAVRAINDDMPYHMVHLVKRALELAELSVKNSRVAILGYSYREDCDDVRNSPSAVLREELLRLGLEVVVHDPWVTEFQGDLVERITGSDVLVLMVGHSDYQTLEWDKIKSALHTPLIVDGRGFFDPKQMRELGFVYYGVGRGKG